MSIRKPLAAFPPSSSQRNLFGEDDARWAPVLTAETRPSRQLSGAGLFNDPLPPITFLDWTGSPTADNKQGTTSNDSLKGGGGNDLLWGLEGNDTIDGEDGDDFIRGDDLTMGTSANPGNDILTGGAGNDQIFGDGGADLLFGGTGNDQLYGDSTNNEWHPTDGGDSIDGGDGDDTLFGGGGNDTLTGGAGADLFSFGATSGGDTTPEIDTITDWGNGADWVYPSYKLRAGDQLNVTIVTPASGNAHPFSAADIAKENGKVSVQGSNGNDSITGGVNADTLIGNAGNDTLTGGTGNDSLTGGDGADSLLGGDGNDTLVGDQDDALLQGGNGTADLLQLGAAFNDRDDSQITTLETVALTAAGLTVNLEAQTEALVINGFADGASAIIGGSGADTITGGTGADSLVGGAGIDSIIGGAGNDTLVGAQDDALLEGGEGAADTLQIGASFDDTSDGQIATVETLALTVNGLTVNLSDQTEGLTIIGFANGASTITGGSGADSITGGSGGDSLSGGGGNDLLTGGAGGDTFHLNGSTAAEIVSITDWGDGDDRLTGALGAGDQLNVTLVKPTPWYARQEFSAQDIAATYGSVSVQGSEGNDAITGGVNADTLVGNAGDDQLIGQAGADSLVGGAGNDTLAGGQGDDTLLGGEGSDWLEGGQEDRLIQGGAGVDALKILADFDDLNDEQIDSIEYVVVSAPFIRVNLSAQTEDLQIRQDASGVATITAGMGNDVLSGSGVLDGGRGNDSLAGGSGDDSLNGSEGNDTLKGSWGSDTLVGGEGDDTLLGKPDDAQLIGGAGTDVLKVDEVFFDRSDAQIDGVELVEIHSWSAPVNLEHQTENLTIKGQDGGYYTITGGSGSDTISSGPNADSLQGGAGSDHLFGLGGDDTLIGGPGDDLLCGGQGSDLFGLAGSDAAETDTITDWGDGWDQFAEGMRLGVGDRLIVQMAGQSFTAEVIAAEFGAVSVTGSATDDTITGGGNSDTLIGGAGNDSLNGGNGADRIEGGADNDSLTGGGGDDTFVLHNSDAAEADTILDWGQGADSIEGQLGAGDTLRIHLAETPMGHDFSAESIAAQNSAVEIFGSSKADTLTGGAGDDTLNGGAGKDALNGGSGADWLFSSGDGDTLNGGDGDDVLVLNWAPGFDASVLGGDGQDTLEIRLGTDASLNATTLTQLRDLQGDPTSTTAANSLGLQISGIERVRLVNENGAAIDNFAPFGSGGTTTVGEDTALVSAALPPAFDVEGDALAYNLVEGAAHGTVTVNSDGTFTYQPERNFTGVDTFTFSINDGKGGARTYTHILNVLPVNDPPSGRNGAERVAADTPFSGTLPSAIDPEGDAVTYAKGAEPQHGSVTVNTNGSYTYTPNTGYVGVDQFTFTVSDALGAARTYTQTVYVGASTQEGSLARTPIDPASTYLARNSSAFAVVRADGSVVAWGDPGRGGDSSAVATQLDGGVDVVQVYSAAEAFAALRSDGSVVTWGDASRGGNSAAVATALNGSVPVAQVTSTAGAFAALRTDGSVIVWGDGSWGGDSSSATDQLDGRVDVTQMTSTSKAFAALRADGSVVTWGEASSGGNSSAVAPQLNGDLDVVQLFSTELAFAALRVDGSVVTWGNSSYGGDSSAVAPLLDGRVAVKQVFSTGTAFAALRADGSVVTWGSGSYGGDSSAVAAKLDGTVDVVRVFSSTFAFAALRADGSLVTWGSPDHGGDSSAAAAQLNGAAAVQEVFSNTYAFAAILADGSVVTWGSPYYGGDSRVVATQLDGSVDVVQVFSTGNAFAALRADGSVVTWGNSYNGGNSSDVAAQLNGEIPVVHVFATHTAFAALRADGSMVTWGYMPYLYDSWALASKLNGDVDVVWAADPFSDDRFHAPTASHGAATTAEDSTLSGNLPAATDPANHKPTYSKTSNPSHGTVTVNADGSYTYVPNANFNGTDSFTFTVTDIGERPGFNTYTQTITVTPVNDAPTAGDGAAVTQRNTKLQGTLPAATDIDGDIVSYAQNTGPQHGSVTVNGDGTYTYIPASSYFGLDSFTFNISDGKGGLATYKQSLTITSVTSVTTVTGSNGADVLTGTSGDDVIQGLGGNDRLTGLAGSDTLEGGAGLDIAVYSSLTRAQATLTQAGSNWQLSSASDGLDSLIGMERIQFQNIALALDVNKDGKLGEGSAGIAAKVANALLGPSQLADKTILGIVLSLLDGGLNYEQLVDLAVHHVYFSVLAGAGGGPVSNTQFVQFVYQNVVGVAPDAATLAVFVGLLDNGTFTQTSLALAACETDFNKLAVNLVGLATNGMEYFPAGG